MDLTLIVVAAIAIAAFALALFAALRAAEGIRLAKYADERVDRWWEMERAGREDARKSAWEQKERFDRLMAYLNVRETESKIQIVKKEA